MRCRGWYGPRDSQIDNAGTADESVTLYLGDRVEIRNFGQGADEVMIGTLTPNLRVVNGVPSVMFHEQLGSVRAMANADGELTETRVYRPFGEMVAAYDPPARVEAPEDRGFVGSG